MQFWQCIEAGSAHGSVTVCAVARYTFVARIPYYHDIHGRSIYMYVHILKYISTVENHKKLANGVTLLELKIYVHWPRILAS